MAKRHAGRFKVSGELLASALGLPEDTLIFNIRRDDFWPDTFEVIVEHPDLPEVPEGSYVPEITPIITEIPGAPVRETLKWDWNLEETAV